MSMRPVAHINCDNQPHSWAIISYGLLNAAVFYIYLFTSFLASDLYQLRETVHFIG